MVERINKIKEEKANKDTLFAKMIGVSQRSMSYYLTGSRSINLDVVIKILDRFPDISSDWLLFGKGEMHVADNLPRFTGVESDTEIERDVLLTKKSMELEACQEELASANERIEELQDLVRFQRDKIRDLEAAMPKKKGA